MRISLAWSNVNQNRRRTLAAICGIAFSILLVFMQLGFLNGAKAAAVSLFECFRYDLAVVSDKYQFVGSTGAFDRIRLTQAQVVPEVESSISLSLATGEWKDIDTEMTCNILLIGTTLNPDFIKDGMILAGLSGLDANNTIMLDLYSHKDYGDLSIGREVKINDVRTTVASHFKLGVTLFAEGCAIVSSDTFSRLTRSDSKQASYGLIRLKSGADPWEVKRKLREVLPADVIIMERNEMLRQEEDYFVSVKPVGIMFKAGVVVAFLVGVVILFQVLATDISRKLGEFATLKAMGFKNSFIYSIGVKQALIYALMSYLPSAALAYVVFRIVHYVSKMPMNFTLSLALFVLSTTLLMCATSCVLALQKIRKTDPAELF